MKIVSRDVHWVTGFVDDIYIFDNGVVSISQYTLYRFKYIKKHLKDFFAKRRK